MIIEDWKPFPKNLPDENGCYLITEDCDGGTTSTGYWNGRRWMSECADDAHVLTHVEAFTVMPEPYRR